MNSLQKQNLNPVGFQEGILRGFLKWVLEGEESESYVEVLAEGGDAFYLMWIPKFQFVSDTPVPGNGADIH